MKYFLITIFLSLSFFSKAQYTNSLTLPLYGSWFLNMYPYKLNRVFFINGIEYKKTIGKNANQGVFGNIVYTVIDYKKKNNEKWYDVRSTNGVPINSYYESNFAFFSLGYYYNQKISKYLNMSYKIGLNYRLESNNKLLIANYPDFGEIVVQSIEFNNTWGGMLGCDMNIPIYKHLSATLGVSYSRFFNNQTIRSKYDGSYIKDPQRNTLVTGFGLTYGFGKKKK
jgi:hypothetical protein